MAAQYGGFGYGSPEVLDPASGTVEIDSSALQSSSVQKAISDLRQYQAGIQKMQAALNAEPQSNFHMVLLKNFDPASLRTTLNTYGTVFDEDTQRGIDRLIRVILQDVTELDIANSVVEGTTRSPRRVGTLQSKFTKLNQAFTDLLAFVGNQ
jgi:hypothetical protein